jgi:guanylate kinase
MLKQRSNPFKMMPDTSNRLKGSLFVLSGPSGVGKTTLRRRVLAHFKQISYSVSYTTRLPRTGEKHGIDYHFIDKESFETGIKQNHWAEWARVHGNYYGTSAILLDQTMARGQNVLLDIDVKGTQQIIEKYPGVITIFIMPPSLDELRRRLTERRTDAPEVIERRIHNASKEMEKKGLYRHVVINTVIDQAAAELFAIIGKKDG